jgi:hypothetical protein
MSHLGIYEMAKSALASIATSFAAPRCAFDSDAFDSGSFDARSALENALTLRDVLR